MRKSSKLILLISLSLGILILLGIWIIFNYQPVSPETPTPYETHTTLDVSSEALFNLEIGETYMLEDDSEITKISYDTYLKQLLSKDELSQDELADLEFQSTYNDMHYFSYSKTFYYSDENFSTALDGVFRLSESAIFDGVGYTAALSTSIKDNPSNYEWVEYMGFVDMVSTSKGPTPQSLTLSGSGYFESVLDNELTLKNIFPFLSTSFSISSPRTYVSETLIMRTTFNFY